MADYSVNFYEGANYALEPKYSDSSLSPYVGTKLPMGAFGMTTDPRTAHQLDAVSKKISTGAKVIEVTGISPDVLEYLPQTHMKEIARLKELTGVEITFHGPLVEPTGVTRDRWDEQQREQAERQIWSAVERSHDMDPNGNIIVTMHSSNGLPETETLIKEEGKEPRATSIAVIDERTGNFGALPKTGKNIWLSDKEYNPYDELKRLNKENWSRTLGNINLEAERASERINHVITLASGGKKGGEETGDKDAVFTAFNKAEKSPEEYEKFMKPFGEKRRLFDSMVNELSYSKRFAEEAYLGLQSSFNQAYGVAERKNDEETKEKLKRYRDKIAPITEKYKGDAVNLVKFADAVGEGVRLLNSIAPPEVFRPLKEFAIDKASSTFSNVAFKAYKEFAYDKPTNTAPIISIENPPVGMGLSKAADLKELVKESRDKFAKKAQQELGLSEQEAQEQAQKLIGVTWDVGHINMLRKYGYTKEDVVKETEKVAKYVKHVHLSDNFGLEHTELPMGMGNVPIKQHEEALKKEMGDKFKQIKQIIETGGWYQHFKTSPLAETFEAFGSPLYPMKMASYWNPTRGTGGNYSSGYGRILPDINFATYGAGFSSLPTELGGQVAGGRSRLAGTPTE